MTPWPLRKAISMGDNGRADMDIVSGQQMTKPSGFDKAAPFLTSKTNRATYTAPIAPLLVPPTDTSQNHRYEPKSTM